MSKKKSKRKKTSQTQDTLTIPQVMEMAMQYHQTGELQQAEALYRQVLQAEPNHSDALHLLGVIAAQVNNNEAAIELIQKAIQINDSVPNFYNSLGNVFWAMGKLSEAADCYQRSLVLDSALTEAHNGLGNVLKEQGKLLEAAESYQRALRSNPHYAEAYYNLGNVRREQGLLDEAVSGYQRAIHLNPNHVEAYYNWGIALIKQNKLPEAIACFKHALALEPNYVEVHNHLGIAFLEQGKLAEAVERFQQAIALNPEHAEAHYNLGTVLNKQGQVVKAIAAYRQALTLNPDHAEAHYNLCIALAEQEHIAEAIDCYQRAIALNTHHVEAHYNLALLLHEQGKLAEAIDAFQQAITLNPNYVKAHNNLGLVFVEQAQFDHAMACYERALAITPNNADTYNNLAAVWTEQNKLNKAIECYLKALRINPNLAEVHFNYGTLLLKKGDLITGWLKYEWRLKIKTGKYPQLKQPLWEGNPLAGRRLLVHWEQGFGDIIQFVRYLPLIKGGTVILAIQSPLKQLLNGLPGVDLLIVKSYDNEPDIAYDVWIPLLSLPNLFATTLDTIPASIPYLYPDSQKVEKWRTRFESARFKIGLVWSGNPKFQYNRNRSASLAHFAPLASVQNISLFSLQKGEAAKQPIPEGMEMIPLTEELEDFSDTAAAINCLDLVISTDTAVPHLAGALGKPVWLLLHFSSDWRWLLDRNDNPWYPTMRLFRQAAPGDWASVFQQVVDALKLELQKFP